MARKSRKQSGKKTQQAVVSYRSALNRAGRHRQAGQFAEAERIYRDILVKKPTHADANLALGLLLKAFGRDQDAVGHLTSAVRSEPGNIDAHLNLAILLGQLGQLEKSSDHYQKVIALKPDFAEAYSNLGNTYRQLGNEAGAETCLLKAIHLKPGLVEAHVNLSTLRYEQGDTVQAQASARAAIESNPGSAQAHSQLAYYKKHETHDSEVRAMEALYATGIADNDKIALGFGLGKAFEDLGNYQKAFSYWDSANCLQHSLSSYEISRDLREMETIKTIFTAAQFSGRSLTDIKAETPVFIVGMPRSGTSLTEQILASHSQVFGAGELATVRQLCWNAVESFPNGLINLSPDEWEGLGQDYVTHLRNLAARETCFVDKMPGNFLYIGMIRLMLPNARIIHCKRDPMDTCLSCFKHFFPAPAMGFTYDLGNLGRYYRAYSDLMAHWQRMFPSWIYDISYEQLVTDPESETRRLLEFCGLPMEDGCLSFYNTERSVRTASTLQVRQPIYRSSISHWENYRQELQSLRQAIGVQRLPWYSRLGAWLGRSQ